MLPCRTEVIKPVIHGMDCQDSPRHEGEMLKEQWREDVDEVVDTLPEQHIDSGMWANMPTTAKN